MIISGEGEEYVAEGAVGDGSIGLVEAKVSSVGAKPIETATKSASLNSPLMMFSGEDEEPLAAKTSDPRITANRGGARSVAIGGDNISSQISRGASDQGLAEATDTAPISSKAALTLQDFREALAANSASPRFIIVRVGDTTLIQPDEVVSRHREENMAIIDALRNVLEKEYSFESRNIVSQVIGQNNLMSYGNSHLSATLLRQIFDRIDQAAERKRRIAVSKAKIMERERLIQEEEAKKRIESNIPSSNEKLVRVLDSFFDGKFEKSDLEDKIETARKEWVVSCRRVICANHILYDALNVHGDTVKSADSQANAIINCPYKNIFHLLEQDRDHDEKKDYYLTESVINASKIAKPFLAQEDMLPKSIVYHGSEWLANIWYDWMKLDAKLNCKQANYRFAQLAQFKEDIKKNKLLALTIATAKREAKIAKACYTLLKRAAQFNKDMINPKINVLKKVEDRLTDKIIKDEFDFSEIYFPRWIEANRIAEMARAQLHATVTDDADQIIITKRALQLAEQSRIAKEYDIKKAKAAKVSDTKTHRDAEGNFLHAEIMLGRSKYQRSNRIKRVEENTEAVAQRLGFKSEVYQLLAAAEQWINEVSAFQKKSIFAIGSERANAMEIQINSANIFQAWVRSEYNLISHREENPFYNSLRSIYQWTIVSRDAEDARKEIDEKFRIKAFWNKAGWND